MRFIYSLLILPLALTACSSGDYWQKFRMPTGWANLDTTPLSSPHGYHDDPLREIAARQAIANDREAWRDGIAKAIMPISSVLDMSIPVAVVAEPPLSPLNASVANYTRDLMVDMSYLVTRPEETTQHVLVQADRIGPETNHLVRLNLTIVRDSIRYASRTIEFVVPPQAAEQQIWPDLGTGLSGRDAAPLPPPKEGYN